MSTEHIWVLTIIWIWFLEPLMMIIMHYIRCNWMFVAQSTSRLTIKCATPHTRMACIRWKHHSLKHVQIFWNLSTLFSYYKQHKNLCFGVYKQFQAESTVKLCKQFFSDTWVLDMEWFWGTYIETSFCTSSVVVVQDQLFMLEPDHWQNVSFASCECFQKTDCYFDKRQVWHDKGMFKEKAR